MVDLDSARVWNKRSSLAGHVCHVYLGYGQNVAEIDNFCSQQCSLGSTVSLSKTIPSLKPNQHIKLS